jgi:hypothetical protein
VSAALGQAARAAHAARRGYQIHQQRIELQPPSANRDIALQILSKAPLALDWLAQPPRALPELVDRLGEEILRRLHLKPWELRRRQILEVAA